jgi:hypothetical protein
MTDFAHYLAKNHATQNMHQDPIPNMFEHRGAALWLDCWLLFLLNREFNIWASFLRGLCYNHPLQLRYHTR